MKLPSVHCLQNRTVGTGWRTKLPTGETVAARLSHLRNPYGIAPVQMLEKPRNKKGTLMKSGPRTRRSSAASYGARRMWMYFALPELIVYTTSKPKPLESQVEMQEKRNNESERMDTYRSLKAVTR